MRTRAALLLCLVSLVGCRRGAVAPAKRATPTNWEYCWWTAVRSTLPPDSVAAHFRRAFIAAGLLDLRWAHIADTVLVLGGPARLPGSAVPFDTATFGALYWSRVVALRSGDSTHFRLYTAIAAPARGWAQPSDSVRAFNRSIGVCQEIASGASLRWIKRLGDPGAEESLSVWNRVP